MKNPKRPIIVPQEYLILNGDSLLQEDIPQCLSDPLPPIQPIAFQPLGNCEKSYYYALAKKGYSILNYYSLFLTLSQSLLKKILKNTKRQIKTFKRNQQLTLLNPKVFHQLKKYRNVKN